MDLEKDKNVQEISKQGSSSPGCLIGFKWFLSGFILPCFSLDFYKKAVRKRLIIAVGFYILFGFALTLLSTIIIGRELRSVDQLIQLAYLRGDIPEIVIENGIASVDAPQPVILIDEEGTLFAIDTTGEIEDIDPTRYYQGMLLTKETLKLLNKGEYQDIQLSELHDIFEQNPIYIDANAVTNLWQRVASILLSLSFVGLFIWNVILRLMFLTFLAIIVWGIASMFRFKTDYGPVLILGIFALVPATYLNYLLGIIGIRFFFLKTLLLLIIWGFVLIRTFSKTTLRKDFQAQAISGDDTGISLPNSTPNLLDQGSDSNDSILPNE